MLYYRDFLIIPGEDQAFIMSALWRALHAHQRAIDAQLVTVPVKYDRPSRRIMLVERQGQLADGFRVFSESKEELDVILDPRIEDAVQAKQIKEAEISGDQSIVVKRIHTLEERIRRKHGKQFIQPEWTLYFWYKKDEALFKYHVHVQVIDGTCEFMSRNTFGCGHVPVKL